MIMEKDNNKKIIDSKENDFFSYVMFEENNKKYFLKSLKTNGKDYINSLNGEIDFLINHNINNTPKIVKYEKGKYILYDYIEGKSLKKIDLNIKESINIVIKLCNILKEIHDIGYCHNDIKRSNIIVNNDEVYLIDFGNCLKFNSSTVFFSPHTASDELFHREEVNHLSDVYSVGMVLKELVKTGDDRINKIIEKCTNKNKNERYQSVIELKNDLLKYDNTSNN